MERLDKIIASQTIYSRKDVKLLVRQKRVLVNDQLINKSDIKINPDTDEIIIDGNLLTLKKNIYLILNKPKGYVSATEDANQPTVLELVPAEYSHRELFPAGRLDKDTTGLMIITDDGQFAHDILSPKKHVTKTYRVKIDTPMTNDMVDGFKNGVELIDGVCKGAKLEIIGEKEGIVTLTEGRYHQIKRMFGCFKAKVEELERLSMGNLYLPSNLSQGSCRELTDEELQQIKSEK